jgi:hypothetical protein
MDLATYLNNIVASTRAWVAEDPSNRWAITPVADVSFWNDLGIFTVEQYVRHSLVGEYSDAYKSANGFRPRTDLSGWTNEQIEEEIKSLYASAKAHAESEAEWDRMDAEWRAEQDKLEAEKKSEDAWVAKWQHHYNRLVGV